MNLGDILVGDGDLEHISKIHQASGYDFRLPDFAGNPLFPVQRSLYHRGQFMAAVLAKLEAEIYLWLDHECGKPEERKEGLEIIHRDLILRCREIGLEQMYCVLPPGVEKSFGPRLSEAGWQKDRGWPRYVYELKTT